MERRYPGPAEALAAGRATGLGEWPHICCGFGVAAQSRGDGHRWITALRGDGAAHEAALSDYARS